MDWHEKQVVNAIWLSAIVATGWASVVAYLTIGNTPDPFSWYILWTVTSVTIAVWIDLCGYTGAAFLAVTLMMVAPVFIARAVG